MTVEKIDLYKYFGITRPENGKGFLTLYINGKFDEFSSNRIRPAMIVCPGGGYSYLSDREGEPIAISYLSKGFNSFILEYSVSPVVYPAQLIEGCMAVAFVRENAERFGIDKEHVAVIGFSAGGHTTAMVGNMFFEKVVLDTLKRKEEDVKPNAIILSYPVFVSGKFAHQFSFDMLTGNNKELTEYLSMDKRVNPKSVPAFIWCTANDQVVPSENSLLAGLSYKANNVPFELHVFPNGVHGLSLATEETANLSMPEMINDSAKKWFKLSVKWLKDLGFKINN